MDGMYEGLRARSAAPLRIATAGSVDDGKSTLIGRLLFDAGAVPEDQREALLRAARAAGRQTPDFSLLTDGLTSEREQGITIDVAWRYFRTARRGFIMADVPGHEQYTRNMVTGASTAEAALILVDVRHGLTRQTRRHLAIAVLLGIRHLVVAVNKMDLVGYRRDAFESVRESVAAAAEGLAEFTRPDSALRFVPVSALCGDNVVLSGARMPWHDGPPLLALLESLPVGDDLAAGPLRFPVQIASRPGNGEGDGFRGYLGRIETGTVAPGDTVTVMPANRTTRVAGIWRDGRPVDRARAPHSVTLALADALDVGRGDMICAAASPPAIGDRAEGWLFWMSARPLDPRRRYLARHGTRILRALVETVHFRLDPETLAREAGPGAPDANDLVFATLRFQAPIPFDSYRGNRATGACILIDADTDETVAAILIAGAAERVPGGDGTL